MSSYESASVIAHGIRLHYYRTGQDDRSLVLVHGITDDGLCWTPVTEVFADRYDVIMVDLRGHGKSEAPEDGYTLENLGTELAYLIQALELKKPTILGHSLGAVTALVMSGLYPDLPGSLILEDPPPFWVPNHFSDPAIEFKEWIIGMKSKTREEILEEGRTNHPDWSEAEIEPWANSKLRFDTKIIELMHPEDYISIAFPHLLRQIKCPMLLIHGNKALGATLTDLDIAKLKTDVPHLEIVYIGNAGHSIRREQFAQFIDILEQYLV
jgi:N-formylmaleamate deformylase